MKDSKTARGEGSLNLSMNKRTHRLWRKTSLVLSLRQFREAQNAGPYLNALPRTAYAACLPPSLPALPHSCQSCSRRPQVNAGCARLKCSLYPDAHAWNAHPTLTRPVKTLDSIPFPYSGSWCAEGWLILIAPQIHSPNRPAPHPLHAGAIKSAQSAQMPPV